jgi:hypothetical protein
MMQSSITRPSHVGGSPAHPAGTVASSPGPASSAGRASRLVASGRSGASGRAGPSVGVASITAAPASRRGPAPSSPQAATAIETASTIGIGRIGTSTRRIADARAGRQRYSVASNA